MNEMVERVARALIGTSDDETWNRLTPETQGYFRDRAADAVRSMRDPTAAMLRASDPWHDMKGDELRQTWRAMIDEAAK